MEIISGCIIYIILRRPKSCSVLRLSHAEVCVRVCVGLSVLLLYKLIKYICCLYCTIAHVWPFHINHMFIIVLSELYF